MKNVTFIRAARALQVVFACVLLTLSAGAQYKEWRPVAPADLSAAAPLVEPDADAEALFWEMRIDDSSEDLDMWHYVRVKIFTERGREKYNKFDIPFVKGAIKIKNLAARVIRADGTMVEIGEKDIFEREIVKRSGIKVMAKSFAVPNIEPGVIVEYKYKEEINWGSAAGMRLQLQRDIPVQQMTYLYKPYKGQPKYIAHNTSGFEFAKDSKGFYRAERRNVSSFKEEPRMPPEDGVRPWVQLTATRNELTFTSGNRLGFVERDPSNVPAYWAGFAATKVVFVTQLAKKNAEVEAATIRVTAGAQTQEEKLRKIYEFCQKEIHNVYYDTKLKPEELKKMGPVLDFSDVLKQKRATQPYAVNFLFAAMAHSLGMEVRLAYTGNRSEVFFDPVMANDRLLHLAAIAVADGGGYKYFFPGNPFMPFGRISWIAEESTAILIGSTSYLWAQTPTSAHDQNNYRRSADLKLLDDGTLEGSVTIELSGQPAMVFRQTYYDETPDKQFQSVESAVKGRISTADVSAISIENLMDSSKPLVQRFKVRIPNYAQRTGKRIFFQPSFFEFGNGAIFAGDERKYDIFFGYAWSENDSVNIEMPAGFELENASSPAPLNDDKKIGLLAFDIHVDEAKRILKVDRKFHFGTKGNLLFSAKTYAPLKRLFDGFHKTDNFSLSLRQK